MTGKATATRKADSATKKAEALLKAGDALSECFPAESRRLLRLCRKWRQKARELKKNEDGASHDRRS